MWISQRLPGFKCLGKVNLLCKTPGLNFFWILYTFQGKSFASSAHYVHLSLNRRMAIYLGDGYLFNLFFKGFFIALISIILEVFWLVEVCTLRVLLLLYCLASTGVIISSQVLQTLPLWKGLQDLPHAFHLFTLIQFGRVAIYPTLITLTLGQNTSYLSHLFCLPWK